LAVMMGPWLVAHDAAPDKATQANAASIAVVRTSMGFMRIIFIRQRGSGQAIPMRWKSDSTGNWAVVRVCFRAVTLGEENAA
jgi:hypothetical protein